jgi:hypothetical protein
MRERALIPGGALALVVVFVTTLLVRLIPARHGVPVDYDEGVYVTAALLLAKGLIPYRDFIFLHPPGIVLFLLPWTLGGPLFALKAARVVSSVLGATNSVLIARLVGGRAALPIAIFWMVWPELVWSERGAFLEPLLSCAGLGALVLITGKASLRRATLAGLLCGVAVLVKSWGVVWCLLAFLSCPQPLRMRLVLSAVATVTAVLLPFLFLTGADLGWQLVLAHVGRPPDGDLSRVVRLREMFVARNPLPGLLTALAIPLVLRRPGPGRVALVGFGVLLAGFLAAPAYWNQYNAALIPFELWVLGAGLNVFFGVLPRTWWAAALAVCATALPSLRIAIAAPATPWPQIAESEQLRSVKGEVCAFEVLELLLVDRLPALTTPVLVDSYGQMLLDAKRGGGHYESAAAALSSEPAQVTLRRQIPACPALRTGWRGESQMNATTKALVDTQFQPVGPGIFERRSPSP